MDDKLKIKTGDLELVDSKIFFAYKDLETIINLETKDGVLNFILKFKNSEKNPEELEKSAKVINNNTLEITFTNYNNALGSFNTSPWKIGTLHKRELFIIYAIYGLKDSEFKKIDASFYIGKEVNNG